MSRPDELGAAPERAILRVLSVALSETRDALIAAPRSAFEPDDGPIKREPEGAAAVVARTILDLSRLLGAELDDYDDALEIDRRRELRGGEPF